MNIKESREPFNFSGDKLVSFLFGGNSEGRNAELKMWTIGLTVGMWFAAAIFGSIVYLMNGTGMVFLESVVFAVMVSTMAGFGISVLSLLAKNDWNDTYGWGIWWRAVIYNIIMFATFYMINTGATVAEHREIVNEFQLVKTDIKDCEYMVKMKSDSLFYNHCSGYDHTYKDIMKDKDLNVYLIGKVRYGTNEADHMETVAKTIVRKKQ